MLRYYVNILELLSLSHYNLKKTLILLIYVYSLLSCLFKLNYLILLLTFNELYKCLKHTHKKLLEGANFKQGSAEEKAKIYYESCLDRNDTVESRGTKPMQDLIESVSD